MFFRKLWLLFCCGKPKSRDNLEEAYCPPKMVFYKKSDVLPQHFSLPKPYMRYLLKNANVEHIKKLQQCCRYFYSIYNFNIIDNLVIRLGKGSTEIHNFDIVIPDKQIEFCQNNLYLNKYLIIGGRCGLKPLYPKIFKCEIQKLVIVVATEFTISDLEFLTKSGSLKILKIGSRIYYSDKNEIAPLEDILLYIPNVSELSMENCLITSKTMTKIFLLKRNVKFCYLSLKLISEFLDPILFNNYIQEMFDFDHQPSSNYLSCIELWGSQNVLEPLFELIKLWRKNSEYYDFAESLIIQ